MKRILISLIALSLMLTPVSVMAVAGAVDVGGMPICMIVTGTSAASAADAVATTRPGFVPDYIHYIDTATNVTSGETYVWVYGMGDGAWLDAGAAAENLYVSSAGSGCWFDVSTAGQVTIDAACQDNDGFWVMMACRYGN